MQGQQASVSSDNVVKLTVAGAYSLALDHFNNARYTDVDHLCTAIIKAVPNNIEALNLLGVVAQKVNRHDLAVEQFMGAMNAGDDSSNVYHNLGISLIQLAKYDAAVDAFRNVLKRDGETLQYYIDLGVALEKAGRFDEAVVTYQEAIAINPDEPLVYNNLGNTLVSQGKLDDALVAYEQAVAINPDEAGFYHSIGRVLTIQGKFVAAVAVCEKAVAVRPDFVESYDTLAQLYSKIGLVDESIVALQKLISLKPEYIDAYLRLGVVFLDRGKVQNALECYKKVLLVEPENLAALSNLGVIFKEKKEFAQAHDYLQKALTLNPDFHAARFNLGNLLEMQGKLSEAIEIYKDIMRRKPSFPKALLELGELLTASAISELVQISVPQSIADSAQRPEIVIPENSAKSAVEQERAVALYDTQATLAEFARGKGSSTSTGGLRIMLIQPPIWKISRTGEAEYDISEGGAIAKQTRETVDGDSVSASYGLLSIASQLLASGRKVLVCNLANFAWSDVENLINHVDVDLVGMNLMTFNLRGATQLAQLIRKVHPKAHIVAGGPHVTPLPAETLQQIQAIDTVVLGEGEQSFLEIVEGLENNQEIKEIAGTGWRENGKVRFAAIRERMQNLDELVPPHDYFPLRIIITSRGCPFKCTFCGSFATWGRKVKMNSVEYILQQLETMVVRNGCDFLSIKDDTFTASKKRTLAICQGIIEKKLNFVWSCDTRVDSLDEEVLLALRLAGCQRISLGIESGSPTVLEVINKRLNPEKVIKVMQMARKVGLQIRFYMIVGNRGETEETFRESLELIKEAQPNDYIFSHLYYVPGTEEFTIYQKKYGLSGYIFFADGYSASDHGYADNLTADASDNLNLWINCFGNHSPFRHYTVAECQQILTRLNGYHAAHMDLAGAYLRDGQSDAAYPHVMAAIAKGYPLIGLALNYLACIAAFHGDLAKVAEYLTQAGVDFKHGIVLENSRRFKKWLSADGAKSNLPLELLVNNNFETQFAQTQPAKPSTLVIDY